MKKYFSVILFIVLASVACKKIINVDLNNANSQLVIEGIVSNSAPAQIIISRSVKFSSSNVFPTVSNATVIIKDNLNNSYTLKENAPGNYVSTSVIGVPGRTYNLSVIADGNTYTASSTMPLQVNLDTLLLERIPFGNKSVTIVKPQYTDPVGFGNNYQFVETINKTVNPKVFVWDDRFNDGGISTRPLIESDSTIASGDSIKVEMRCLDKNIFRYFTSLADLQQNATTPANPESNISGGCLGYFSAHTSQRKKVLIP
jgi:hypothetical protein